MAGTMTGGQKTARTLKLKYGEDYYKKVGAIGGQRKVPKGFASNPELASKAGALGGSISRRGKVVKGGA